MKQELKDLSPKTIRKTVKKEALQKPLTSYGLAASLFGLAYIGLFGLSSFILAGALALGLVALGSWVYEAIIKGDATANSLVHRYRKQLEQRRKESIKSLREDLNAFNESDALKQLELFEKKYASFVDVLNKKLNPSELAYNRYLSIAEQVYLGGLDNLTNAAVSLQSVSAIDVEHIQTSLQQLGASKDDETKGLALQQRLSIWQDAQARAKELKLQNELALTNLDKVSSKIALVQTSSGNASIALEDSMEELKRLISRADQLSN